MSRFGDAVADDVDVLVHDVDATFLGDGAGEDVVGEEGSRVGEKVVSLHLTIDGIFLFHGRDPTWSLLAILRDIENPIIALTSQPVGRYIGRNVCAIDGNGMGRCKGTKARVNHIGAAADSDGEEYVLAHAFMARFE